MSGAQASDEDAELLLEAKARLEAIAIPLDGFVVLSDSNSCLWAVVEDGEGLELIRHLDAEGDPLCAAEPAPKRAGSADGKI